MTFTGSLVAIATPMHPDGALDFDAWERLLALHLDAGTAGIIVGGTTGESATLTEPELLELLDRARRRLGDRIALLAGAGSSSTAATLERVRSLCRAAIDGILLVTPAYNKPTQEGLFRHFEAAARVATVPVMVYNVPSRTAVDLLPETMARLAELPRIQALKEAQGTVARIRELVRVLPARIAVLSGDDATARESVAAGARGVVSVTANVAPAAMVAMMRAALDGRVEEAARLDAPLAGLHQALFLESNPIAVKWALARMGLIQAGIRLPLTWLAESHHQPLEAALVAAGVINRTQQVRSA